MTVKTGILQLMRMRWNTTERHRGSLSQEVISTVIFTSGLDIYVSEFSVFYVITRTHTYNDSATCITEI